jgi:hypothetical protein
MHHRPRQADDYEDQVIYRQPRRDLVTCWARKSQSTLRLQDRLIGTYKISEIVGLPAYFLVGMVVECQTERGDEFPGR